MTQHGFGGFGLISKELNISATWIRKQVSSNKYSSKQIVISQQKKKIINKGSGFSFNSDAEARFGGIV